MSVGESVGYYKGKKLYQFSVGVRCYINKTQNNVFVTLTDLEGNVIIQLSGGNIGMKGPRRSTPNAAELVGRRMGARMLSLGHRRCIMVVKGPFDNIVKSVIRGLKVHRVRIMEMQQGKGVSHNGIRPRRPRRM